MKAFVTYLKELRHRKRLTTRQVAERAKAIARLPSEHFSHAYVVDLEAGRIKRPSPSKLWILAQVYGVDPIHLLGRAGLGQSVFDRLRDLQTVLDSAERTLLDPEEKKSSKGLKGLEHISPEGLNLYVKTAMERLRKNPHVAEVRARYFTAEQRAWMDAIEEVKARPGGDEILRLIEGALKAAGVTPPSERTEKL